MKVFVFGYDRYATTTTSGMLEQEDIDHIMLVHNDEQKEGFIAGGRVKPERLTVTGKPAGLSNNRNAALDMMDDGEWAMFLVDDFKSVSELQGYDTTYEEVLDITTQNVNAWGKRFKNPISMAQYLKRAEQGTRYCDKMGCNLLGFAGIDNALFRRRKFAINVLADGRAWMVKKTHLRFDTNVQLIDDLCWTALNIKEFGIVIVNQWVLPDCRRYTAGAFGSKEQRMPQKIREAKYLVETYPDLITYKQKAGWPDGSHVVLRPHRPARHKD